ncbi:7591_t:CDS:2 [Dentiscutata erythropus]|uniref:7591_t:CDS:1 n=1 Tax=Dentiscutata erythropus TaxID=1348616 RepID=A0A9N9D9F9_9GLOM|nr:7591_t:CDS:2 [Dentiscutata erythropus]
MAEISYSPSNYKQPNSNTHITEKEQIAVNIIEHMDNGQMLH